MKRCSSQPLAWFIAAVLGSGFASAAAAKPPTIADLRSRQVEVRRGVPVLADAAKAKAAYEQFLQLERGDEVLRAEAMRRLADLKLTDGEFARLVQDLAQGSPLETSDAILLYRRLLETYPGYARNDAVLYQLARALDADGQPDESAATLARLVTEHPLASRNGVPFETEMHGFRVLLGILEPDPEFLTSPKGPPSPDGGVSKQQ